MKTLATIIVIDFAWAVAIHAFKESPDNTPTLERIKTNFKDVAGVQIDTVSTCAGFVYGEIKEHGPQAITDFQRSFDR